jgi:hypothetical protein
VGNPVAVAVGNPVAVAVGNPVGVVVDVAVADTVGVGEGELVSVGMVLRVAVVVVVGVAVGVVRLQISSKDRNAGGGTTAACVSPHTQPTTIPGVTSRFPADHRRCHVPA